MSESWEEETLLDIFIHGQQIERIGKRSIQKSVQVMPRKGICWLPEENLQRKVVWEMHRIVQHFSPAFFWIASDEVKWTQSWLRGYMLLDFYKKQILFGSLGTSQMLINWEGLCQYFHHVVSEKNMYNRNVLCNESSNTVSIQITALRVDYYRVILALLEVCC